MLVVPPLLNPPEIYFGMYVSIHWHANKKTEFGSLGLSFIAALRLSNAQSGCRDLNPGPLAPQTSTLTGLSYIPRF